MQTKLTLRLEESLIEEAKREAERRGTSLSRLVADLFRTLTAARGSIESGGPGVEASAQDLCELSPRTRRLLGALGQKECDADAYKSHLEEKHLG